MYIHVHVYTVYSQIEAPASFPIFNLDTGFNTLMNVAP